MQQILFTGLTGKSGSALLGYLKGEHLDRQFNVRVAIRPTSNTVVLEDDFQAQLHRGLLEDVAYLKDEISLAEVFSLIAKGLNCKRKLFSVPFPIAYCGAWGVYLVSFFKIDFREQVQRLCEERVFSHQDATSDFRYNPMPFKDGISEEVQQYLSYNRKI